MEASNKGLDSARVNQELVKRLQEIGVNMSRLQEGLSVLVNSFKELDNGLKRLQENIIKMNGVLGEILQIKAFGDSIKYLNSAIDRLSEICSCKGGKGEEGDSGGNGFWGWYDKMTSRIANTINILGALYKGIKLGIKGINWLKSLESVQEIMKAFKTAMINFGKCLGGLLGGLSKGLGGLFGGLSKGLGGLFGIGKKGADKGVGKVTEVLGSGSKGKGSKGMEGVRAFSRRAGGAAVAGGKAVVAGGKAVVGGAIGGAKWLGSGLGNLMKYISSMKVLNVVMRVASIIGGIFNAVMLANPIGLIVLGVALAVGAIILFIAYFDEIAAVCGKVFSWIGKVFKGTFSAIVKGVKAYFRFVIGVFKGIGRVVSIVFGFIKKVVMGYFRFVIGVFRGIWNVVSGVWESIWGCISGVIERLKECLAPFFDSLDKIGVWLGLKGEKKIEIDEKGNKVVTEELSRVEQTRESMKKNESNIKPIVLRREVVEENRFASGGFADNGSASGGFAGEGSKGGSSKGGSSKGEEIKEEEEREYVGSDGRVYSSKYGKRSEEGGVSKYTYINPYSPNVNKLSNGKEGYHSKDYEGSSSNSSNSNSNSMSNSTTSFNSSNSSNNGYNSSNHASNSSNHASNSSNHASNSSNHASNSSNNGYNSSKYISNTSNSKSSNNQSNQGGNNSKGNNTNHTTNIVQHFNINIDGNNTDIDELVEEITRKFKAQKALLMRG